MKTKKTRSTIQKRPAEKATAPLSAAKKRAFTIFMLLVPILFFALLETGLQVFHYGIDTRLFISIPDATSRFYGINTEVGKRYFYRENFNPSPRKDLFLKEKPANGYRIFVLGGSTTAGFPYGNNITFPRILGKRLADTFPDRHIEVVNTALTAINSYTLLDFMDEILAQKPDALLIYAGHNEFYGALGVASMESLGRIRPVVKLFLKLKNYKTFVLIRNLTGRIYMSLHGVSTTARMQDPMKTVMSRMVGNKSIPLDSPLYKAGKKQFQANLGEILAKARAAGVPVLISELVSNISDQLPFTSTASDTLPPAETVFTRAQKLEQERQYDKARAAYYRAKDLDALRFRATEEFNDIIRNTAAAFGASVVPMQAVFTEASPNGLIGNTLIHEHLHPNIAGYFLMADAFFQVMRRENFIAQEWPATNIKPASFYRANWGYTALDSIYAALSVVQLKGSWPFTSGGPNVALAQYTPAGKQDSIALRIMQTGESTLELGHLEMANWYKQQGETDKALAEYKALVYIVPYLDLFYEPYLELLLNSGQYERAEAMLTEALRYNDSGFIYKWLGQIQLALNSTGEGITNLEKARLTLPTDEQLLYNLCRAYYKSMKMEKGDAIRTQLYKIAPASVLEELDDFRQAQTASN
ncbi:MAG TPA: SGNH/GDSL hydrolase family protein [bacterium]|nr:SGNH/GDSL hydrolase family protein [bacterium]HPN41875.1 SGNH/GDSL hydrolase family protein [bacterium]